METVIIANRTINLAMTCIIALNNYEKIDSGEKSKLLTWWPMAKKNKKIKKTSGYYVKFVLTISR